MADFILTLDQGTTSSRAILFDERGQMQALRQREFEQHYPQDGWVEHDPEEIWQSQYACACELAESLAEGDRIRAIGITNQRETVVAWKRDSGETLGRAIVWQDRRTAEACERYRQEGWEEELTERTGLLFDPYFSGTKMGWILEARPEAAAEAAKGNLCLGTVDSFLTHRLSGRALTDGSNASRTLLYNLETGQWDDSLLERFGVDRSCLPEIVESSAEIAEVSLEGPLKGLPICGIAGDQQAALFGQGCFEAGEAKNTYGTGCFLLMNTGSERPRSKNRLLSTLAWQIGGQRTYALEGSVFVGGAVIQWLRDGLGIIEQSADVEALTAGLEDSAGVVFVPAFTGLGAPHWDPHARGALFGLTRGTTAAHIARAAVESIAMQSAELVEAMEADAGNGLQALRVDGGASINNALMQLQADLLSCPVIRPRELESTARGAAFLAGLAVGLWPKLETLKGLLEEDRRFEGSASKEAVTAQRKRWDEALRRAQGWATH